MISLFYVGIQKQSRGKNGGAKFKCIGGKCILVKIKECNHTRDCKGNRKCRKKKCICRKHICKVSRLKVKTKKNLLQTFQTNIITVSIFNVSILASIKLFIGGM